jgi:twitching motility protein PilI
MAKRISLREFQEGLVRRLAEASATDRRTLLGLQAGNESWLVELAEAGEILPPPPLANVPLTRHWFRGLANVRHTLFGVIDFSVLNGGPATAPGGSARLVLIGAKTGVNTALLVSRTTGLRSPDDFDAEIGMADESRPWGTQRLRDMHGRPWLRLDVATLMSHPRFLEAGLEA